MKVAYAIRRGFVIPDTGLCIEGRYIIRDRPMSGELSGGLTIPCALAVTRPHLKPEPQAHGAFLSVHLDAT